MQLGQNRPGAGHEADLPTPRTEQAGASALGLAAQAPADSVTQTVSGAVSGAAGGGSSAVAEPFSALPLGDVAAQGDPPQGEAAQGDLVRLIRLHPLVCQLVLPPVYRLVCLLPLVYQLQALPYIQKCHRDLLLVYSVALQSQRCTLMALSDGGC
jgi:hypothetical protein